VLSGSGDDGGKYEMKSNEIEFAKKSKHQIISTTTNTKQGKFGT
jgi:hypothetical protein